MTGFEDNTFRLAQAATPYEFARVALYLLDYGPMAENSGWTEADFNKRIVSTGLLKGINSAELTEGNATVILYNMLKEPVVIVESITNKGADFKTSADKTYITEKCSLLKCRGEIRADGDTTAVGIEKTGKGYDGQSLRRAYGRRICKLRGRTELEVQKRFSVLQQENFVGRR